MRKAGALLGILLTTTVVQLFGQARADHRALATKNEVWMEGLPLASIPRWSGSRLASCDECQSREPLIWAIDEYGHREEVSLVIQNAGYISVSDVAAGADDALAVVGYALSDASKIADLVVWISPDRKRQVVMRTTPFVPYVVTMAPDGTIWAVGTVKAGEDTTDDLYPNVVRHFDSTGALLHSAIVDVRGRAGLARVSDGSALMASGDRVGWMTRACEYVEFTFSAREIGRYDCPNQLANSGGLGGVALSSDDEIAVGGPGGSFAPLRLNRANRTWAPIGRAARLEGSVPNPGLRQN